MQLRRHISLREISAFPDLSDIVYYQLKLNPDIGMWNAYFFQYFIINIIYV